VYSLLRPLLFRFPAETAHHLTMAGLATATPLLRQRRFDKPVDLMGLQFPNPVGLAAGMDKNAQCITGFGKLGFGFVEVGTVTPRPQAGNPKPRLFRLPQAGGIINRMGFNNEGVDAMVARLKKRRYDGILGVNIGRNKTTPNEQAVSDYRSTLEAVYPYADYITINISSPNTPGLRELQGKDELDSLLKAMDDARGAMAEQHNRRVPLAVKIAPDLPDDAVREAAELIASRGMDAIIATNTTIERGAVAGLRHADETGGLSGTPVKVRATEVVALVRDTLGPSFPLIGVGGISTAADALEKRQAGADLVQVYSGLVYRGPALIEEIAKAW